MQNVRFEAREQNARLNRTSSRLTIQFANFSLIAFLFLIIVGLFSLYIYNYNDLSTKGYVLSKIENYQKELDVDRQMLITKESKLKSLDNIVLKDAVKYMRRPNDARMTFIYDDSVFTAQK